MDNPVQDISGVIASLATGDPTEQQATLDNYFLSEASFSHPLCRVPSFAKGTVPFAPGVDSRAIILQIYRWYRTLSPHIDITVDSAVFDKRTGRLFVEIHQTLAIWFLPLYRARVRLITLLHLRQGSPSEDGRSGGTGRERGRYFIAGQEDLYTINDCCQFLLPGLGPLMWYAWQLFSTGLCVLGAFVFMPVYLYMNRNAKVAKVQ
ncbi:flavin-binding monooxygenase-like protein [Ophiocordyceps camponoti-floridani]|uniref:Flavin-binding monooxygenase-like protein n=1 Tax=Ophiocordyceps camponoti-floridani TaxID=2030778 RepID=A0A8H4Q5A7_9HYPO|nr:flavin-binding monooxygenase-like protein [Ophiocordyceps camponoti-floridani]